MMIETAMVGRDGALNAASALDGKVSPNKGIVQMAGSAGTIQVDRLRRLSGHVFLHCKCLLLTQSGHSNDPFTA
jgi:hypothetical protein